MNVSSEPVSNLVVCGHGADRLVIEVIRRTHIDATDIWDGNWLASNIEVKAGVFTCALLCDLRADAFEKFRDELDVLVKNTAIIGGCAGFHTLEPWIDIQITSDGAGRSEMYTEIKSALRSGHQLNVVFQLDRNHLEGMLAQVQTICRKFPAFKNSK